MAQLGENWNAKVIGESGLPWFVIGLVQFDGHHSVLDGCIEPLSADCV
jgi:hypothetical protein